MKQAWLWWSIFWKWRGRSWIKQPVLSMSKELKWTSKEVSGKAQAMFFKGLKDVGGKEDQVKVVCGNLQISFLEVGQGQRCLAAKTLARAKVTHRKVSKLKKMWCRVRILRWWWSQVDPRPEWLGGCPKTRLELCSCFELTSIVNVLLPYL